MLPSLRSAIVGLIFAAWSAGAFVLPAHAADAPVARQTSATSDNPSGATRYRLAHAFKPNQTVWYDVRHEMQITTQFGEVTDVARNKSESRKYYRVIDVDADKCGDLELIIDWVHMTATNRENGPAMEFRSDDSNFHGPQFKEILDVIGKAQATIKFSPAGIPLKVTTVRPLPEGPAGTDDASPENYLLPLPEGLVVVGDAWKERYEVTTRTTENLPRKVAMLRTYRLASVEGRQANVEFKTTILSPINDPAISAQLIQRETSGRIAFDLDEGVILSRDVEVDRTVINPFGPKSTLRAVSRYQERRLPPGEARSKQPPPDAAASAGKSTKTAAKTVAKSRAKIPANASSKSPAKTAAKPGAKD